MFDTAKVSTNIFGKCTDVVEIWFLKTYIITKQGKVEIDMQKLRDTTQSDREEKLLAILREKDAARREGTLECYNRKAELTALGNRENAILTSMAAGIDAAGDMTYTRTQCIKLMYFIDREMGEIAGFNFFNFYPWKYGAFDEEVFNSLEDLAKRGLIKLHGEGSKKYYELTERGLQIGKEFLIKMTSEFKEYFIETARWIKSKSFDAIVWTSYSLYPEMKTEASEFKDVEIGFEKQCEFVLDRIMHRRRHLIEHFGDNDE